MTGPTGPRDDDAPTEPNPPVDPPTERVSPADPPTEHLPPVVGGGSAAWSEYPASGGPPTGGYPTSSYPVDGYPEHAPSPGAVPPPGDDGAGGGSGPGGGDGGWDGDRDEGGGGTSTPWIVAAVLLTIVLVAGLIVWLVSADGQDRAPVAAPTTSLSTQPSSQRTTARPTTPTTTRPPGVAERCSPGFVTDELGGGTTVQECDEQFLLITRDDGKLELHSWRDDTWEFLAAPSSDVCREQLEQLGVPDRFRRVFQTCAALTSNAASSATTSTSPSPPATPTSSTRPSDGTTTTVTTTPSEGRTSGVSAEGDTAADPKDGEGAGAEERAAAADADAAAAAGGQAAAVGGA